MDAAPIDPAIRRAVRLVALLNLSWFGIEFAVARAIGSVSLFADSIDFLEDASINLLILASLGWSAARRARVGMALAGILLVPGLATLWMAWRSSTFRRRQIPSRSRSPERAPSRSISFALSCWPAFAREAAA